MLNHYRGRRCWIITGEEDVESLQGKKMLNHYRGRICWIITGEEDVESLQGKKMLNHYRGRRCWIITGEEDVESLQGKKMLNHYRGRRCWIITGEEDVESLQGKKMLNHYKKRWTNYTTGRNTLCWSSILKNVSLRLMSKRKSCQSTNSTIWMKTNSKSLHPKKILESFLMISSRLMSTSFFLQIQFMSEMLIYTAENLCLLYVFVKKTFNHV